MGNEFHVKDNKGHRFSLVYFTLGCHSKMKKEDKETLTKLGLVVPPADADPFKFLCPPGKMCKQVRDSLKQVPTPSRASRQLPASRYWKKAALVGKRTK